MGGGALGMAYVPHTHGRVLPLLLSAWHLYRSLMRGGWCRSPVGRRGRRRGERAGWRASAANCPDHASVSVMWCGSLPTQRNLYACHKMILKGCAAENKEFMMCKAENEDPRACAELGCAAAQLSSHRVDAPSSRTAACYSGGRACAWIAVRR